jgi:hypothetical protein
VGQYYEILELIRKDVAFKEAIENPGMAAPASGAYRVNHESPARRKSIRAYARLLRTQPSARRNPLNLSVSGSIEVTR